eukprot:2301344-Amphidinium_carterae.1
MIELSCAKKPNCGTATSDVSKREQIINYVQELLQESGAESAPRPTRKPPYEFAQLTQVLEKRTYPRLLFKSELLPFTFLWRWEVQLWYLENADVFCDVDTLVLMLSFADALVVT